MREDKLLSTKEDKRQYTRLTEYKTAREQRYRRYPVQDADAALNSSLQRAD